MAFSDLDENIWIYFKSWRVKPITFSDIF